MKWTPGWLVPSIFTDWKFYLNLAGSEMPLVSIESMSKVLKNARSSIIDSFPLPNKDRLEKVVQLKRLTIYFLLVLFVIWNKSYRILIIQ